MSIDLVVVDHHQTSIDFSKPNITSVKVGNLKEFYKEVRSYLQEDYDLVISDEDPDGITSVIIYSLFKEKVQNFLGNRTGLKKEDIFKLEFQGIKTIVAFDWWPLANSDLDSFNNIVYLNPRTSNLPNVNASEIVFQALPETGKFGRDISAIGTVCDYLVDTAQDKFKEFIEDYSDLFRDLLPIAREGKLDRYNFLSLNGKNTLLYDLSLMFWAPFILEGDEGNKKFIELIVNNPSFNINELVTGSENPAVIYVRSMFQELNDLINQEKNNFYQNRVIFGNVHFYEPKIHKSGFMTKFSSIICDELEPNQIVAMKSKSTNNSGIVRYSLRSQGKYNLGEILIELGVGGGHETAAGANVPVERLEWFEKELVRRVSQ